MTSTRSLSKRLDGHTGTTSFAVGCPAYTFPIAEQSRTITGPENADGVERTVSLVGNRLNDAYEGEELKVKGVLRVLRHEAAVVNGVFVDVWKEILLMEN